MYYKCIDHAAIKSFCSFCNLNFRKSCNFFKIVVMGGISIFFNIISSENCKSGHSGIRKIMFM